MIAEVVIPAPAKLLTHNAERSLHHMERASIVKLWRKSAKVWAQVTRTPKFKSVEVSFLIEQAKGKLADNGAHIPVTKAIVDGLVDARIIKDDTGEYVTRITYLPVIRGEKDQVTVVLEGEERLDEHEVTGSGVLHDYQVKRQASITRHQKNCPHLKHPTGICLDCGARC